MTEKVDIPAVVGGPAPMPPPTPELDNQRAARDEGHSEDIGAFLEWLESRGLVFARWRGERLEPDYASINARLAEYFGIDLSKIEEERLAILDYVRSLP